MAPRNKSGGRGPMLVHDEQNKQVLEQIQTQAAARAITDRDMIKLLGEISTSLDQMRENGGGFGGTGGVGPHGGPNGGRPIAPGDQSRRPGGGIPGGLGPWNMGAGYAGGRPGFGGIFGAAQLAAANYVHNRRGLGRVENRYEENGVAPSGSNRPVGYRRQDDGSYNSYDFQGNIVETGIDEQTMRRREQTSNSAYQGGAVSTIGGAIRSLPFVGKAAGTAFGVAEAGEKFGNFVGDQRKANAAYESIYGPGTSGFDQRQQNFAGRIGNTIRNIGSAFGLSDGGLTDSDYDKSFKAISAMGYQGGDRNKRLDFIRGNFNRLGMSPDESIKLAAVNAQTAATNFAELGKKLEQVSKMAQQTGQSAEVFRQRFAASYETAVKAGFGASSGIAAEANTAATVGQGRLFSGLDTSKMYSNTGQRAVLASQLGYTSVLDFSLATAKDPRVLAKAQDSILDQTLGAAVSPDVKRMVEEQIARTPGGAQRVATDQDSARNVVQAIEEANPGALDAISIQSALMTAQIGGAENLDETAAAIYYVQWVAKQNGSGKSQSLSNPTAKGYAARQQQVGTKRATAGREINRTLAKAGFGKLNVAYTKDSKGRSVFDPIIQKAINDNVSRVEVQTAGGKKVVSLEEAAKNYRDQLTTGSATIVGGDSSGRSIAEVYGKEDNARDKSTTYSKRKGGGVFSDKLQKQLNALGLDEEQMAQLESVRGGLGMFGNKVSDKQLLGIARDIKKGGSGGGQGRITVDLKPAVKKYLDINLTGDNLVDQAATQGAPPANPSGGSSTNGGR